MRVCVLFFQFRNGSYAVGDFMTKKGNLQVLKPSTSVEEGILNL